MLPLFCYYYNIHLHHWNNKSLKCNYEFLTRLNLTIWLKVIPDNLSDTCRYLVETEHLFLMAVYYNRMFYRATPAVVSHWVYVKFKYSHNKILRTTNWDKPYLFQEYANIFKCVESISVAFFTLELFLTVIASGNGCRISPAQKGFHIHWLGIRLNSVRDWAMVWKPTSVIIVWYSNRLSCCFSILFWIFDTNGP